MLTLMKSLALDQPKVTYKLHAALKSVTFAPGNLCMLCSIPAGRRRFFSPLCCCGRRFFPGKKALINEASLLIIHH